MSRLRGTTRAAGETLTASICSAGTDAVDPNPQITVSDTASSFVAGPYASGTKIKLVQAPGGRYAEREAGSRRDQLEDHAERRRCRHRHGRVGKQHDRTLQGCRRRRSNRRQSLMIERRPATSGPPLVFLAGDRDRHAGPMRTTSQRMAACRAGRSRVRRRCRERRRRSPGRAARSGRGRRRTPGGRSSARSARARTARRRARAELDRLLDEERAARRRRRRLADDGLEGRTAWPLR